MKPNAALWMMVLSIPAAVGAGIGGPGVTCTAGAASIPVFNPTSTSGAVGDYTLSCTGGTTGQLFQTNFTSFMNVSVLNTGGWILTDGVNNYPGTLGLSNVVNFNNVSINPPGAGQLNLQVENIFVNPSGLPPGAQFREDMTAASSVTINNPDQEVAVNATPEISTLPLTGLALGAVGCAFLLRRVR